MNPASLMENMRFVLWIAVIALFWSLFSTWKMDYGPAAPDPATEMAAAADAGQLPGRALDDLPALPDVVADAEEGKTRAVRPETPAAAVETPVEDEAAERIIHVRTDVLDIEIDARGGVLRSAKLPVYPQKKDRPDLPVQLLNPDPEAFYAIQTGLRSVNGGREANHLELMQVEQSEYRLADGSDELVVTLHWEAPGEVRVAKHYRFQRGSYIIGLDYEVENLGVDPYTVSSYLQILRLNDPPARSYLNVDSYSFTGPVTYDGKKKIKHAVKDLVAEPLKYTLAGGWLASIEHHFVGAVIPPDEEQYSYQTTVRNNIYTLSTIGPGTVVAPGETAQLGAQLFVGPKLQSQLEQVTKSLRLAVDYGRLTILAQPLFWLLQLIHGLVGNWGWSIILATVVIKALFYKLTEASGRSMARMRKLQPRMKSIQERYKDDKQKQSQALMELYKREKVNPAAGCLPMFIQVPFFIAYYWVLLESVEVRQAPFMGWISDLSTRDPFFILPLLMAGIMFVQARLNPAPPDPTQAMLMRWMPVAMAGLFAFFPAGLVLYWVTNSLLSVIQQWHINKAIAAD